MSKSAEAFRTISEVADELEIAKHVLRFWENRFPQIKPMKRGGGRRYYRPEDLDLLRGIRHLLHNEGYTIRGVQKILRQQGVETVKLCWQSGAPAVIPEALETQKPDAPARKKLKASAAKQPARGNKRASKAEPQSIILDAIRELQQCRDILVGKAKPANASGKPRRQPKAGA